MKPQGKGGFVEGLGILALGLLAIWLLDESWRKWADPLIDSGPQWYDTWRVSLGALPYRDFAWNYGPLSILFNGFLFKCFGPGMMVLATANLIIYAGIAALAYVAFRRAWGRLAAFSAVAIFITVFSFSKLNDVGNYNYVLPYSNETTHGLLVILLTAFVAARWVEKASVGTAALLGLCGGITAVLKPEFMLAGAALGILALVLRWRQGLAVTPRERGALLLGLILPTLVFTMWLARGESWSAAFLHSGQAWRLAFVSQLGQPSINQSSYMGFNDGWRHAFWELTASAEAALVIAAIWAAGWFLNRPWPVFLRWAAALGVLVLAWSIDLGGFEIGPCFPGLALVVFIVVAAQAWREWRKQGTIEARTTMALALVVIGGAMLARMALRARINHFGFVQAALAGMVLTAFIVTEVPRWTGPGRLGQWVARLGLIGMFILSVRLVVLDSAAHHVVMTQTVGQGRDQFYAVRADRDDTGQMVDWCLQRLQLAKAGDTLLVLPEGVMINYLSRHERPQLEFQRNETNYIEALKRVRPDYVILIWGDQRDGGMDHFGDPGQPGAQIRAWLTQNYALENTFRGRPKWAFLMHRKSPN